MHARQSCVLGKIWPFLRADEAHVSLCKQNKHGKDKAKGTLYARHFDLHTFPYTLYCRPSKCYLLFLQLNPVNATRL